MNLGHLYVVHTTLSKPPKDKLVICVCAEANLFMWINSLERPHGDGQMPLVQNEHSALSKACFLDCSRVTTFRPHELAAAQDRGKISAALNEKIVGFLTEHPPRLLPPNQRAKVIGNLSDI